MQLGEPLTLPSNQLIERSGDGLEGLLKDSETYVDTPDGRRLSNLGYAVSADMGLLIAKCLFDIGKGKVEWATLRKPKSAQSFNLPVLVGFSTKVGLDPVAASIAQATGVLRGSSKRDPWLKMFEYWSERI